MKRYIVSTFLGLLMMAGAAHASTWVFSLTQDGCSGGCGAGPYGTVTLVGESGYVQVTENLTSGDEFVKTGAGDALEFQLVSAPTSIAALTSGFSVTTGTQSASTFGSFSNGIKCSGCGNGASKPLPGPISFDVYGVTTADFVANSDGNYFASDILGSNGKTGNVAANYGVDPPSATPEPGTASLLVLGGALVLAGLLRSRRNQKQ